MTETTPAELLTALQLIEDTIAQLPGADAKWELTYEQHTGLDLVIHPEGELAIEFRCANVRQLAQELTAYLAPPPVRRALSDKEKQNYLRNPTHCPWCGCEDWEGVDIEIDGDKAIQQLVCADCDARWYDIYQLADIRPIN